MGKAGSILSYGTTNFDLVSNKMCGKAVHAMSEMVNSFM